MSDNIFKMICSLFTSSVSYFFFMRLCDKIYESKKGVFIKTAACVAVIVIMQFVHLFQNSYLNFMFSILLSQISCSLLYNAPLKKSLLKNIYYRIASASGEIIAVAFVGIITKNKPSEVVLNSPIMLISCLIYILVMFFIYRIYSMIWLTRTLNSLNWLTNSAGLKQEYTYDKAFKQTGLKEYDGDKLVKTFTYDYDEKYAVKTNKVETDGHTYDVDKITYNMIDDENKYDEMSESVDIMGNTTKYERDENGNVIKQINPDGTFTLARYNDKNMPLVQVDESNNVVISEYDESGVNVVKKYQSLHTVSNAADLVKSSFNLSSLDYTDYAMTVYTYYPASETAEIAGLIRTITDAEGHITEYTYGTSGNAKGLPIKKVIKDGNTVVNSVEYEYNSQLQVSKEKTSVDISRNIYAVKEYEYDKFNNVTKVKDFGTGSTAAVTISEYDKLSRKTAEYTPNFSADKSHGTLTTYYPSGAVKTQTDALGNVTSFTYDAYGKTIEKTNPDGTVNGAEYDGLQREKATYFRVSEDYPKQILTSTEYKFESGKLRTIKTNYITAEKQVVTETLADFRGNTVQEKTNGEIKRTSVYYANGQLKSQTDALGNTTKYEYNYLNKLTKTIAPFDERNAETVNEYDKNGNVIKVIQNIDDGKKSITRNQYNAMGLLERVTLSDGTLNGGKNITKYFYNNAGIQTKMYTGMIRLHYRTMIISVCICLWISANLQFCAAWLMLFRYTVMQPKQTKWIFLMMSILLSHR